MARLMTYGAGSVWAFRTDTASATPVKIADLEEASVQWSGKLIKKYGQSRVAIAIARGEEEIKVKLKFASQQARILSDLYHGVALTPGMLDTANAEAAVAANSVQVAHHATFLFDNGVMNINNGVPFQKMPYVAPVAPATVCPNLVAGQYSVNIATGAYCFSAYTYTACLNWGLCEGPIPGIGTIWSAKTPYTATQLGYSVFTGTSPQTPWGFLSGDAIIQEEWTIPAAAPFTVTVNYPGAPFVDEGVDSGTGQAFTLYSTATQTQSFTVPTAAPFTVQVVAGTILADGGVVFGAVDDSGEETDQSLTAVSGTPTAGQYAVNLGTATYSFDGSAAGQVVTISWEPAVGSPPEGQYSVVAGTYAFSSADAGRDVTILYSSGNQQPPSHALSYPGIAYMAGSAIDLGDSPSLPNHNVEVMGFFCGSVPGWLDADPSLVVNALLTNKRWGLGNIFPAALVGSLASYQSYCISAGLLVSWALTEQSSAAQLIGDLATYTNADVAWTGGTLTLLPRGDQPISGNGAVWNPPAVVATLGDDDWLDTGNATTASGASLNDPLVMGRTRAADAVNQVTIEILNRANQYAPEPVTAPDPAAIAAYGLNAGQTQQAHMFADMRAGRKSAQLLVQRNAARQTWQGTVGAQWGQLDIGDWLYINRSSRNLVNRLVRITEITRPQDRSLQLVMEEIPSGAGTAAAHTVPVGLADKPLWNAEPPDVNAPVLFEPPDALGGGIALWAAASGPLGWGGCQVWASLDQETYSRVGTITAPSIQGSLTAPLAAVSLAATGPTIDQVNTLAVLLDGGVLPSTTQAGALALQTTLCWVDGEVIAYQTATLTGAESYCLSWLVRGCYGTPINAHAIGAPFALLAAPIFTYPLVPSQIGQTIYLKFPSFNSFGGELQDLAELQPYAHTVTGAALATALPDVTGLTTAYVAGITQLVWSAVTDFRAVDYEMRLGPTAATAQRVGRTPLLQAPCCGNGTYWVAAHYQVPSGGDVYSAAWTEVVVTGAQLVANVIASTDEAATGWSGGFVNAGLGDGGVMVGGIGNILSTTNILGVTDITEYGGVAGSGSYTIPAAHRVNIGRVAACNVAISIGLAGHSVTDNVLTAGNLLATTDVTGAGLGPKVSGTPQIRLSQDGVTWGPWQQWIPGSYVAMEYDFQVVLSSLDPQVIPVLTAFSFAVDVPDRIEDHQVAVPAGGLTVSYPGSPFNGSAAGNGVAPNPQITIVGAQAGDDLILGMPTLAGFPIQIVNSGASVARTINYRSQGY